MLVKVRLVGPESSERIWVRVTEAGSLGFVGQLDNHPVCPGHNAGDTIARPWEDVLEKVEN